MRPAPLAAPLDVEAIAREMKQAQDRVAQLEPFTARHPGFDLPFGYDVAARVGELRRAEGFVPVGRKIGFTNTSLWPVYDVHHPIWGTMYDRTVVRVEGGVTRLSLRGFTEPMIEPEIALGLRSVPAPSAAPATLLRSIEWIAHGFEIVQSHFPGWKFRAADTVADNGLHGAYLLGPPLEVSQLGPDLADSLRNFSVDLSCDGALKETGRGANALGSPLAALAHLVSVLADRPRSALRPGEIVTTGTLTAAYRVAPGEEWSTELRGIALAGLRVRFTD